MSMELMSPAGNKDSFLAAVNGKADSIYLGLKKFNARRPAGNFSISDLKKAVSYAHKKNIKIYLALNIDLKSNELKETVQIIDLASKIGVNGIIIKDPALIHVIQHFYQNIDIHFSTQNAITSSLAALFLKSIKIKRIVLARELSLEEIKEISDTGIEIEIFTEGSMCFSISGRCLMSSWVGSRSGNRGMCTAPCRVIWELNNKEDLYFSMKDLSLFNQLDKIKQTNVTALKIEGRLKRPEWVFHLTKAYRNALDNDNINIEELFNELKKYSAREKTTGHIFSHNSLCGKNNDWENYEKVTEYDPGLDSTTENIFKMNNKLLIKAVDEKINIEILYDNSTYKMTFTQVNKPKKAKSYNLTRLKELLELNNIIEKNEIEIEIEHINLKFSGSFFQKTAKKIIDKISKIITEIEKLPEPGTETINFINPKTSNKKRNLLLGNTCDEIIISAKDINKFLNINYNIKTIIVSLDQNVNFYDIKKLDNKYNVIFSIPPVLYEVKAKKINLYIKELSEKGYNNFEANSYTGIYILNQVKCNKYIGHEFPVMNYLAANFFYNLGFSSVFASVECDKSMLKALSSFTSGNIKCIIFARLPLFQSRVSSDYFINNAVFTDKFKIEIKCIKQEENSIFVSRKPYCLIGKKFKSENITFDNLRADLRFSDSPVKDLDKIFSGFWNEKNTHSFNFFSKLV